MPHTLHARRLALPRLLTLALALAGASAMSQQERSPYYIGVSQAFAHESNVFRTATNEVSETISSTGVLAGVDLPFGRQRVFADAAAQYNRYQNSDQLNNKSYGLSAGVDWETVEFLSGTLRYARRNSLADFGTGIGGDQTSDQFTANAHYGFTRNLSFEAGYDHRRLDFADPSAANRKYSQDAVNAGLRWTTGGVLTLGAGVRSTKGRTPEFQTAPPYEDELKRRDIDLSATWVPSGFSTLNTRISSTRQTRSLASTGETSEVTGSISWIYRPTAKLGINVLLSRDTGTETTFIGTSTTSTTPLPVDNNRLSNSAHLEARYEATAKISLNGGIHQRNGTQSTGDDKVKGYVLGASYLPTRAIALNCNVLREDRTVTGGPGYVSTTSTCSAQVTLR